jgi:hypothetical protein
MAIQRAVAIGTIGSTVQIRNVFHADVIPGLADPAIDLWYTYLNYLYGFVAQCLCGVVQYTSFETYVPVAGDWILEDQHVLAISGAEGTDYLPNAVALVIEGIASGSRHIGKKFFSGVAEGFTSGNVLTGAAVGYIASALLGYISPCYGLSSGSLTPGVVDKNFQFHPFVGGVVASLLGSQRRRKPGVGI